MSPAARVGALGLHSPVVRASLALIVNTGLNAVLGLAYWVTAARLLPSDIVGAGAAGVSSVMFVASLGWAGAQFVLLRYVPVAGRATGRLVVAAYIVALVAAVSAGVVFLLAARQQPDLAFLTADVAAGALFLGAVATWVVFSLQDAVLVGIGRAAWVPLENAAFGFTKLALLVVLTTLASPWALVASWFGATVALVLIVNAILARRPTRDQDPSLPPARRLVRFGLEQHAITILVASSDTLVPLLVLAVLGPASNAYYYAAWTVSFSLRLMVVNIGSALTAESSRTGVDRAAASRHASRLAALLIAPIVLVTFVIAPFLMRIYGDEYVAAADALRLFALGLVPFAIVSLFIARQRVAERGGAALAVAALAAAVTLTVSVVAVPAYGITGTGAAWLIGWSAAAIPVLLAGRRADRNAVPGHTT